MNVALSNVIVELHVPNFDTVRNFYNKLGFEEVWSYPAKNQSGYLVMKRGNSILSFFCGNNEVYNHSYFRRFPKNTPRGYGVEISIYIEDIDISKYYQSIISNIPENNIVQPLKIKSWGTKDFRLIDPFGFYLCFREPNNILVP